MDHCTCPADPNGPHVDPDTGDRYGTDPACRYHGIAQRLASQARLDTDNARRKRLQDREWWQMPVSSLTLERDPKAILGGLKLVCEDGQLRFKR